MEKQKREKLDKSLKIKAIEFYSGIGGFHYGLLLSGVNSIVIQAFDINLNANEIL